MRSCICIFTIFCYISIAIIYLVFCVFHAQISEDIEKELKSQLRAERQLTNELSLHVSSLDESVSVSSIELQKSFQAAQPLEANFGADKDTIRTLRASMLAIQSKLSATELELQNQTKIYVQKLEYMQKQLKEQAMKQRTQGQLESEKHNLELQKRKLQSEQQMQQLEIEKQKRRLRAEQKAMLLLKHSSPPAQQAQRGTASQSVNSFEVPLASLPHSRETTLTQPQNSESRLVAPFYAESEVETVTTPRQGPGSRLPEAKLEVYGTTSSQQEQSTDSSSVSLYNL